MKPKEFNDRIKLFLRLRRTLPVLLGNKAKNFFVANFRKQGFDDKGVEKWQPRKFNGLARQKKDSGRAILVKTGNLRRSIRVKSASMSKIVISSDLDYAAVHNDGTNKMPQRKFIGDSENLRKELTKTITKEIKKALLNQ